MHKLGVVIGDNTNFFQSYREALSSRYAVEYFEFQAHAYPLMSERLNRLRYRWAWQSFVERRDILFFEWASERLAMASWLPKRGPVLARLLGYELFTWAPQVNWEYVDRVIVLLEAVRRQFAERYPAHQHKCVVLPVGLDLSVYDPTPHAYQGHVGILGNITPRKRVYELVLAFAEMLAQGLDLHLFIAGMHSEKYERDYLPIARLPEKLGIAERVHLEGYVPSTPQWLKKIDILISNSYTETQHVALQEAMASGCYALAHFWDGVEEFMPPENIFGTNRELCEKVAAFHQLPAEQKQARQRALLPVVENFCDSRKVVPQMLDLIGGLLPAV